jgi:CheY-like chemotaxis protein
MARRRPPPSAPRRLATGRERTPIIALTANVMAQQIESYRAAGMEMAVAKPIESRRTD